MRNRWALVLLLAATVLCTHAPAAVAQNNCQAFKALTQATIVLDTATMPPVFLEDPGAAGFAWGGSVFAVTGSRGAAGLATVEGMAGWFWGRDAATEAIYGNANGRGKDGYYLFAFGTHDENGWNTPDRFKFQIGQAVWTPNPGGLFSVGSYQASGKLVEGYGRFEGATGSFTLHGDFIFYPVAAFPGFVAAWNPALEGSVCR